MANRRLQNPVSLRVVSMGRGAADAPGIHRYQRVCTNEHGCSNTARSPSRHLEPPWPDEPPAVAPGSVYRPKWTCPPQFCVASRGLKLLSPARLVCDLDVAALWPLPEDDS